MNSSPIELLATEICPETNSWLRDTVVDASVMRLGSALIRKGTRVHAELIASTGLREADYVLRTRSAIERAVSYQLHTHRELRMMLDGKKNFAVFSRHKSERIWHLGSQKFNKFGSVIKRETRKFEDGSYAFFYLDGSSWKVESYMALLLCTKNLGPSQHTEFLEGLLLGYSLEQNTEYINNFWLKIAGDRIAP